MALFRSSIIAQVSYYFSRNFSFGLSWLSYKIFVKKTAMKTPVTKAHIYLDLYFRGRYCLSLEYSNHEPELVGKIEVEPELSLSPLKELIR